jgi:hypothetical protein
MATALSKGLMTQLAALGITAKTEEKARELIYPILASEGVEGIDELDINSLVQMVEVFKEAAPADEEEQQEEELEEQLEEQEEVQAPAKKPAGKPAPTKPVAADKKPSSKTEEEELDEVATEVKSKGIVKKPAAAPVVAQSAKKTVAVVGRKTELTGDKWDGRNNKAHDAMIKPFRETFPAADFQIDLLKQGFTVRVLGTNAKTTILNFDEIRISEGNLIGNLYCNRFKDVNELAPYLPDSFEGKEVGMFRGESHPCIRKVTDDELLEILHTDFITETLARASSTDVKMGKNREKLEQAQQSTTATKPAAKPASKAPIPAVGKKNVAAVDPVEELEQELEEELEEELIEEEMEEELDPYVDMDRSALKKHIKDNSLDIKVYTTTTDESLREQIRAAKSA